LTHKTGGRQNSIALEGEAVEAHNERLQSGLTHPKELCLC
jgi:hypothetical protein